VKIGRFRDLFGHISNFTHSIPTGSGGVTGVFASPQLSSPLAPPPPKPEKKVREQYEKIKKIVKCLPRTVNKTTAILRG